MSTITRNAYISAIDDPLKSDEGLVRVYTRGCRQFSNGVNFGPDESIDSVFLMKPDDITENLKVGAQVKVTLEVQDISIREIMSDEEIEDLFQEIKKIDKRLDKPNAVWRIYPRKPNVMYMGFIRSDGSMRLLWSMDFNFFTKENAVSKFKEIYDENKDCLPSYDELDLRWPYYNEYVPYY